MAKKFDKSDNLCYIIIVIVYYFVLSVVDTFCNLERGSIMVIDVSDLDKIRQEYKKILLVTGTFDLFHIGHLQVLNKSIAIAKAHGCILVVAVKDDASAHLKGQDRPIICEDQRASIVDAIKGVDYTVIAKYDPSYELDIEFDNPTQEQWLKTFNEIFKNLRPDFMLHEDSSVLKTARERAFQKYSITSLSKDREAGISTTQIIEKIRNQ